MEYKKDDLYNIFLSCSFSDIMNLFENAKTKDEQKFYITLYNIMLEREHKKSMNE